VKIDIVCFWRFGVIQ